MNRFGNLLATDDNGGEGQNSLLEGFSSLARNTFYIQVSSADQSSGPDRGYSFMVRERCSPDIFEQNDSVRHAASLELSPIAYPLTLCDEDWFSVRFNLDDFIGISLYNDDAANELESITVELFDNNLTPRDGFK